MARTVTTHPDDIIIRTRADAGGRADGAIRRPFASGGWRPCPMQRMRRRRWRRGRGEKHPPPRRRWFRPGRRRRMLPCLDFLSLLVWSIECNRWFLAITHNRNLSPIYPAVLLLPNWIDVRAVKWRRSVGGACPPHYVDNST